MKKKVVSLMLCAAISATVVFSSTSLAATKSSVVKEKTDEILVQTDASGNVVEKKGYVTIVGADSKSTIKDKTIMTNISNVSGDEKYTVNDDGTISWENKGKDIKYIGNLDADLPITMKVEYYLDDQKMEPKDLAGKSGRLKVVYSFENHTSMTVDLDGEKYTTCVPVFTMTSIVLPKNGFNNVESLDGGLNVDEFGDKYFMVGTTAPGTGDALNLKMLGLDEFISIPESFGFTADVTDFQMPSTTTSIVPYAIDQLDLSGFETESEIEEKVDELVEATKKLVAGSSELNDGTEAMSDGLIRFVNGYKDGMTQLAEGSTSLNSDLSDLENKRDALKNEAEKLLKNMNDLLEELNDFELPTAESLNAEEFEAAETQLKDDTTKLIAALEKLESQLTEVKEFADEAQQKIDTMNEIRKKIEDEMQAVDVDKMINDATELAKQQAIAAAKEELSGLGLPVSDAQINTIAENIMSKVDISSVGNDAKKHIENIQNEMNKLPTIEIPEIDVDVEGIVSILKDMETQYVVLDKASATLKDMLPILDSANELLDSVKESSDEIKGKSNELVSGLNFADSTIQSAHSYLKQLNEAAASGNSGSDQLLDGMNALDDGAKQLAQGTEQYYSEGILTAADYAKQATLQAFIKRGRALIEAAGKYTNLSGKEDSTEGRISFVVQTAAIEKSK